MVFWEGHHKRRMDSVEMERHKRRADGTQTLQFFFLFPVLRRREFLPGRCGPMEEAGASSECVRVARAGAAGGFSCLVFQVGMWDEGRGGRNQPNRGACVLLPSISTRSMIPILRPQQMQLQVPEADESLLVGNKTQIGRIRPGRMQAWQPGSAFLVSPGASSFVLLQHNLEDTNNPRCSAAASLQGQASLQAL